MSSLLSGLCLAINVVFIGFVGTAILLVISTVGAFAVSLVVYRYWDNSLIVLGLTFVSTWFTLSVVLGYAQGIAQKYVTLALRQPFSTRVRRNRYADLPELSKSEFWYNTIYQALLLMPAATIGLVFTKFFAQLTTIFTDWLGIQIPYPYFWLWATYLVMTITVWSIYHLTHNWVIKMYMRARKVGKEQGGLKALKLLITEEFRTS